MSGKYVSVTNLSRMCSSCSCRAKSQRRTTTFTPKTFSTLNIQRQNANSNADDKKEGSSSQNEPKEESAMARRLSEMTEDAFLEGGRSARKSVQEAGFSDDLKAKLEERVAASTFKSDYAAAHSIVDMPVCLSFELERCSVWLLTGHYYCRKAQDKGLGMLQDPRLGLELKSFLISFSEC